MTTTDSTSSPALAAAGDLGDPGRYADGDTLTLRGGLWIVCRRLTRNGFPWATLTLTDATGDAEIIVFPVTYARVSALLVPGAQVSILGRLNRAHAPDAPSVYAQEVS
jgi:DNA polymerase III alpha subunit